jgi:hypothetical protein
MRDADFLNILTDYDFFDLVGAEVKGIGGHKGILTRITVMTRKGERLILIADGETIKISDGEIAENGDSAKGEE